MIQTSTKNQSVLQSFVGAVLMTFIGIFVNRGLKKKTVAADTKLSSLVKMLLMRAVFQGNFILVGRVLRFYAGRQGLKKISLLLFSLSAAVALLGGVL